MWCGFKEKLSHRLLCHGKRRSAFGRPQSNHGMKKTLMRNLKPYFFTHRKFMATPGRSQPVPLADFSSLLYIGKQLRRQLQSLGLSYVQQFPTGMIEPADTATSCSCVEVNIDQRKFSFPLNSVQQFL